MKKVALFATILALALAASAQEYHSVGPNVIAPNARGGDHASANGVTRTEPANAKAASAAANTTPIRDIDPNAIQKVGPTASKHREICLPIIVDNRAVGPPCK